MTRLDISTLEGARELAQLGGYAVPEAAAILIRVIADPQQPIEERNRASLALRNLDREMPLRRSNQEYEAPTLEDAPHRHVWANAERYADAYAAAWLVTTAATNESPELRRRSLLAIEALDLTRPLHPARDPLDEAGAVIGSVIVDLMRTGDPVERRHVLERWIRPALDLINRAARYYAWQRRKRTL